MEHYFESIQNDITIGDLECEIEYDRTNLLIKTCENAINLYQESTDSNDETIVLEAGNKIVNGIKNLIKKVIAFINNCIEKIQTVLMEKKIKKMQSDLETAMKKYPGLKDRVIELNLDDSEIQQIEKELRETIKGYNAVKDPELLKKYLDVKLIEKTVDEDVKQLKKMSKMTKITLITVGTTITATIGGFIARCKEKRKLLDKTYEIMEKIDDLEYNADHEFKKSKYNDLSDNAFGKTRDVHLKIDDGRERAKEAAITASSKTVDSFRYLIPKTINLLRGNVAKEIKMHMECANKCYNDANKILNEFKEADRDSLEK